MICPVILVGRALSSGVRYHHVSSGGKGTGMRETEGGERKGGLGGEGKGRLRGEGEKKWESREQERGGRGEGNGKRDGGEGEGGKRRRERVCVCVCEREGVCICREGRVVYPKSPSALVKITRPCR